MTRTGHPRQQPAARTTQSSPSPAVPGVSLAALFAELGSSAEGLPVEEARRRLERFGHNLLKGDDGSHPVAILANQFRSPLVVILLAAAALTFALGETTESLIIAAIVVGSSALGFYQEYRASSAVAALRRRLEITTVALRDGAGRTVAASDIVRGDVLQLAAGSLVPADAVLIEATELHLDEAALTGESFPVVKAAAPANGPLNDDNRIHMGTSVRSGTAKALVLQTGGATQFGALALAVGKLEPETSFA